MAYQIGIPNLYQTPYGLPTRENVVSIIEPNKRTLDYCILGPSENRRYDPKDGRWHDSPLIDINFPEPKLDGLVCI